MADSSPADTSLQVLIAKAAAEHGDRPAIVAEQTWSFTRLAREADSVACALLRRGVCRGDRVAIKVPPSAEALVLLAGIATAGASVAPFDVGAPAARVAAAMKDIRARLIIDGADVLSELIASGVSDLRDPDVLGDVRPSAEDEAYVITTSGSTGAPKGVSVAHGAIAAHARLAASYFGLTPQDRTLQFASLAFDVAQEEIWASWAAGSAVVINPCWLPDAARLAEIVADHGVTVLQLPTAYWRTITAESSRLPAEAFAGVRLVIVGGEPAYRGDLIAHSRSPLARAELINGYGPTETVVTSLAYRLAAGASLPAEEQVPIGTPFPGRRVAVVTSEGEAASPGQKGELWIGDLLATGYVNRPGLTAARFTDAPGADWWPPAKRWYRTGDQVEVMPGGELAFRGRLDDQVKLRGFRIELGEIESALREIGTVRAAAATLLERPGAEPQLGALVVSHNGSVDLAAAEVQLRGRLPEAFVPSVWAQSSAIPLTHAGKVDRGAVARLIASNAETAAPAVAPVTGNSSLVAMLAPVWQEVLGVSEVDPHADFFGLGGDSLLAVRFAARAKAAGVAIKPADVVKQRTLGAIAASTTLLTAGTPSNSGTAEPVELLPAQYRWLLDGRIADVHHFLVSALLEIDPQTPDGVMHDVAAALLEQHAALSSRFDLSAPSVTLSHRAPEDVLWDVDVPAVTDLRDLAYRVKTDLDPSRADVFRLVRLRGPATDWLLILVHHLVLDGWSMALLVDEVDTALQHRLAEGRARLDTPSASVGSVRRAVEAYLASDQARRDAHAWLRCPFGDIVPIARRRAGAGQLGSIMTSRSAIDGGTTARILHGLPTDFARPVELLRCAIQVAVAEWAQTETVAIDVYDSQRAAPVGGLDVSRTIGYLQSTHPEVARVRGSGESAVVQLLRAPRIAPVNLFSFDALRFLSPVQAERDALQDLPRSPLRLNYRSQLSRLEQRRPGSPLRDADLATGPDRAPTQNERYDLMFEGDVIDRQLVVGAKFSTDHFDETDVQALTDRVAQLMHSCVEAVTR